MTETPTLPLTAAARHLAEHGADMERAIAARQTELHANAEAMTKDELRELLDADTNPYVKAQAAMPKKTAPRAEYVEAAVRRQIVMTDEHKALRDAHSAVRKEEDVEGMVRAIIDRRDTELAELTAEIAKGTSPTAKAKLASYWMQWHIGPFMALTIAGTEAETYLAARRRSVEPVEIATHIAKDAISKLKGLALSGQNLSVSGHGLQRIAEADGHRMILEAVGGVLSADVKDLVGCWH